jgi:hypothetical protein
VPLYCSPRARLDAKGQFDQALTGRKVKRISDNDFRSGHYEPPSDRRGEGAAAKYSHPKLNDVDPRLARRRACPHR